MKSNYYLVLIILSLHIASTSAFLKYSQIPGGYGDVDLKDKGVIEADAYVRAHFKESCVLKPAVTYIGKLIRAKQQVVAGINYTLSYKQNNTGVLLVVTIFKGLPNQNGVQELSISNCVRK